MNIFFSIVTNYVLFKYLTGKINCICFFKKSIEKPAFSPFSYYELYYCKVICTRYEGPGVKIVLSFIFTSRMDYPSFHFNYLILFPSGEEGEFCITSQYIEFWPLGREKYTGKLWPMLLGQISPEILINKREPETSLHQYWPNYPHFHTVIVTCIFSS